MKKAAFLGMVILFVLFLGTCGMAGGGMTQDVEYTDVSYSSDGKSVTMYFDGKGVPVTQSQRSMTLKLAEMAYDYLEVIFYYRPVGAVSPTIARAAWDLGQRAGISGVYRAGVGVDYGTVRSSLAAGEGTAIIMVGRKSDRTLFGVGKLTHVDGTTNTTITTTTSSITFTVKPTLVKLVDDSNPLNVDFKQDFLTANGDTTNFSVVSAANTTGRMMTLGDDQYPMYSLVQGEEIAATYAFNGWVADTDINPGVFVVNKPAGTGARPQIQHREPRINYKNNNYYPEATICRVTTVSFPTAALAGPLLDNAVFPTTAIPLSIDTTKSKTPGLFSFLLQIPVYGLTNTNPSTNGGPDSTTWYVCSGYGTSLYNVDNGVGDGGCVLIGVGNVPDADYIGITTIGIGIERW